MREGLADYVMAERVAFGCFLFLWRADGKLHQMPERPYTLAGMPLGIAARDLEAGATVRLLNDGKIHPLIFNPCGDRHLGRCCINGLRSDGSRGLTCTHCGDAITEDQRDDICKSFRSIEAIIRKAGGKLHYEK